MSSIGQNIKELRIRRGYSQEELGELIGKTRSAISQYESEKIIPRMGVIEDIARVFHVPKEVVIRGFAANETVDNEERELLSLYRNMDARHREMLMETARSFAALSVKDGAGITEDVERTGITVG